MILNKKLLKSMCNIDKLLPKLNWNALLTIGFLSQKYELECNLILKIYHI